MNKGATPLYSPPHTPTTLWFSSLHGTHITRATNTTLGRKAHNNKSSDGTRRSTWKRPSKKTSSVAKRCQEFCQGMLDGYFDVVVFTIRRRKILNRILCPCYDWALCYWANAHVWVHSNIIGYWPFLITWRWYCVRSYASSISNSKRRFHIRRKEGQNNEMQMM